jgi:hypothetical protein
MESGTMCPFFYWGRCVLIETKGKYKLFDIYCTQDNVWHKKFGKLPECLFDGKDKKNLCSHRKGYRSWMEVEINASWLENRGF